MERLVVPDASVILKWALRCTDEKDSEHALALLGAWLEGETEIALPKLWVFEVANVLMMKAPGLAEDLLEVLTAYGFREVETSSDLCKEAFRLMKRYKVTFYDASYHAAAVVTGGVLVTADEAYVRKTSDRGHVAMLRQWQAA
jgi:predicted nucleic acid-binding protein